MSTLTVVIVCGALLLIMVFALQASSHTKWHTEWLDKQSPAGVWSTQQDGAEILLQFEQGPTEGTYRQITRLPDGKEVKEFGHWAAHRHQLDLLIMAMEIPNHPRFGVVTVYSISYVGPDRIRIFGPDRPNLVYQREPEGTVVYKGPGEE